jgi:hypothetical protein
MGDDTSGLEKRLEITDEHRAQALVAFIQEMQWKLEPQRPSTPEEREKWERNPIAQFMAMFGPPPKAGGRHQSA